MKRLWMWVCVAAMCLTTMTVTTFAAEPASLYTDVSVDSPYYESIKWATETGLTVGTGNSKFSPDGVLSYGQLTMIMLRQYMPEHAPQSDRTDWEANVIGTADWFGLYYYNDAETMRENGVTWQSVWNVVLDCAGVAPYPYWYYTGEEPDVNFDKDAAYMVQASGLSDADPAFSILVFLSSN